MPTHNNPSNLLTAKTREIFTAHAAKVLPEVAKAVLEQLAEWVDQTASAPVMPVIVILSPVVTPIVMGLAGTVSVMVLDVFGQFAEVMPWVKNVQFPPVVEPAAHLLG